MQVPTTLDRFDEQLPDDETCIEALPRLRWPGDFVRPELDESCLGGAISGGPRSRGALNERLLRNLRDFSYRLALRATEDE